MSNFTKGPWMIDGNDISPESHVELSICCMQPADFDDENVKPWGYGETTSANAHLICAAPDLLAALEGLMLWLENCDVSFMNDDNYMADHDNARAAITKALGAK